MGSVAEIRSHFLRYFYSNGHTQVPSSPLVPANDPSLMFTNAGMVQFKNAFTGNESLDFAKATSSQKCVRAGGKHNDLDNVGYTSRHHTFFEMLGNFSFGDYFKETAIELAWNLITKEFGLPKNKLLVTVYAEDTEAAKIWKKVAGFSDDKIIKINTSDNFWAMGDTGPCGPCSEIFYDHGEKIPGGPPGSEEADGDRYTEIWNLVFMQFEQVNKDKRIDLPNPAIDTGMGLERISAILQGKHDNYEIDLFKTIMDASAAYSDNKVNGKYSVSHRIIADHLRASTFLIADGVMPSNEGRGYVLRRIMRRAMRHAHLMGNEEPLMHHLVPVLVKEMEDAYPEIKRAQPLVLDTMLTEETKFKSTLSRGLSLLQTAVDKLPTGADLPGKIAFQLYDTYGFPFDLTQDALRNLGHGVDKVGFEEAMNLQREEARKHWAGSGASATDLVWFSIKEDVGTTEFLGYEHEVAEGQIVAIVKDGKKVNSAKAGENVNIITNQTPFYGESGGQVGDSGSITSTEGSKGIISDTKKYANGLVVHSMKLETGELECNQFVKLSVDQKRRSLLRANHSVTHLLHSALRNQLGNHISQKGSLVGPDKLRFDISHPKPITADQLNKVESEVNNKIRQNILLTTKLMTPEKAIEEGALALFGEKYGAEVRVVSIKQNKSQLPYSIELCGGTHVNRTGDIGMFRIISETATAAGIRRIEALTGEPAHEYVLEQMSFLQQTSSILKVSTGALPERLLALLKERKHLEKEIDKLNTQIISGSGNKDTSEVEVVGNINFVGRMLKDISSKDMRNLVDALKIKITSGVVVVLSAKDGKVSIIVGITEDLKDIINATTLVKIGVDKIGGKGGGGRSDMAQGGGPKTDMMGQALKSIKLEIQKIIAN